ncbi:MAG: TetR family transcriptional regulator [Candidatus Accumulibacter sp.]|nr:TetR family transcriptional regulator [Accumulibacter sp.]
MNSFYRIPTTYGIITHGLQPSIDMSRLEVNTTLILIENSEVEVRKTKAETEQTRAEIIGAARRAFHEFGVSRTSLEKVAQMAGVTRGAIYWHFDNKAMLFYAMRDQVLAYLTPIDADLISGDMSDPLDAIEKFLFGLTDALENNPLLRQTFEIMLWRCEYVNEFATVLHEVIRPRLDFLSVLKSLYERAAHRGFLRPMLDPEAMAYDTLSFTTGLLHHWLIALGDCQRCPQIRKSIRDHIALRRRDPLLEAR